MENFEFVSPTHFVFGRGAEEQVGEKLAAAGAKRVLVHFGGGSAVASGLIDRVGASLDAAGIEHLELGGVRPNPEITLVREGVRLCKEAGVDWILAVGGGSCVDYAKAVAVSKDLPAGEDPWDVYFDRFEEPAADREVVPVGSVLTMVGTGSEMNRGSVITNRELGRKIGHVFTDERVSPRFAVLNPEFTYTVPRYQMVAGIFDIMNHITEQYFSNTDDNTSDYLAEGLMPSLVTASRAVVANPTDYEARSNIMWTATWALNTLVGCGKTQDWEVHMIGQAVGAVTDATHGMTLSAVALPYYRLIMPYGLEKFARFATNVWGIDTAGKTNEELAAAGLNAMENWMREIGCVMSIRELGADESSLDAIADATLTMTGGYRTLTRAEVLNVLRKSLAAK